MMIYDRASDLRVRYYILWVYWSDLHATDETIIIVVVVVSVIDVIL